MQKNQPRTMVKKRRDGGIMVWSARGARAGRRERNTFTGRSCLHTQKTRYQLYRGFAFVSSPGVLTRSTPHSLELRSWPTPLGLPPGGMPGTL